MATLVVSDLHLGMADGRDVALRPDLRAKLLELAAQADEVVLLGDVLELRERPQERALDAARPFFADLADAVGGRPVTLVPGNHDHALVRPWVERRLRLGESLGPEMVVDPAQASPAAAVVAGWLGSRLRLRYPGIYLRPGVYATHGHYLDRHVTVPAFETLGWRVVERAQGEVPAGVAGYETVCRTVCAALDRLGERRGTRSQEGLTASGRAYRVLAGPRPGARRPLRHRFVSGVVFPSVVGALNRAGLGPFTGDVSRLEMRRSSLVALGAVLDGLGVEADHAIFGHAHRAGPLAGDEREEWSGPRGVRLHNSGCWIWEPLFAGRTPNRSPYWPGACVWLEGDTPPRVRRLLGYRSRDDLLGMPGTKQTA